MHPAQRVRRNASSFELGGIIADQHQIAVVEVVRERWPTGCLRSPAPPVTADLIFIGIELRLLNDSSSSSEPTWPDPQLRK